MTIIPSNNAFILEDLKVTDAESLYYTISSNSERLKTYFPNTLAQNQSLEYSIIYINNKIKEREEKTEFTYAIKDPLNKYVVGLIILKELDYQKSEGELAYFIAQDFQGQGWVSQGVKTIITFAFEELKIACLRIIAHKTNFGSIKVTKNCGFIWKQTLIKEFTPSNSLPMDMELYELRRENITSK